MGKVVTLSEEETAQVEKSINERMEEVNLEYKIKQAKSIEDAKRTYIW